METKHSEELKTRFLSGHGRLAVSGQQKNCYKTIAGTMVL